jgi:hypothetical protein
MRYDSFSKENIAFGNLDRLNDLSATKTAALRGQLWRHDARAEYEVLKLQAAGYR